MSNQQESHMSSTALDSSSSVTHLGNAHEYYSFSSPSCYESYTCSVVKTAAAGVFAGAAVDAAGAGTGGGALIVGGIVGAGVGLVAATVFKCSNAFERQYIAAARAGVEESVERERVGESVVDYLANQPEAKERGLLCGITLAIPRQPVTTKFTKQVYERAALERWIKEHGTCPDTRDTVTIEDLRIPLHTYTALIDLCDKNRDKLAEKEKEALEVLRSDYAKNRLQITALQMKEMQELIAKKEIDATKIAEHYLNLAASWNTSLLPPDTDPNQFLSQAKTRNQTLQLTATASAAAPSSTAAAAAKPSSSTDHKS